MIIYVDILLLVNFLVDFFLIRATAYLLKTRIGLKRNILASIISSLFSLIIFLPPINTFLSFILKIIPAILVAIICNIHKNFKMLLRWTLFFLGTSFIYAGFMMALWMLFKPSKLAIFNGIVYFNISPLLLITLSFVFYVIFLLISKVTTLNSQTAKRVDISLKFNDKTLKTKAMVDTGHTISDVFGNSIMIIIEKRVAVSLFGLNETEDMIMLKMPDRDDLKAKYRVVTVNTVSGEKLMPGIRLSGFMIHKKNDEKSINSVVAILSDNDFNDDYSCIIPDSILI